MNKETRRPLPQSEPEYPRSPARDGIIGTIAILAKVVLRFVNKYERANQLHRFGGSATNPSSFPRVIRDRK